MKKIKLIILIFIVLISVGSIITVLYYGSVERSMAAEFAHAKELFEAGKYTEALPGLLGTIKNDGTNQEAYQMAAVIYEEQRNFEVAAQCYQRAAALNPLDGSLPLKQAHALSCGALYEPLYFLLNDKFKAGRLTEDEFGYFLEAVAAIGSNAELEAVLAKMPSKRNAQLSLAHGMTLVRKNQPDAAKKEMLAAIDGTNCDKYIKLKALLFCARQFVAENNMAEARKFFVMAVDSMPEMASFQYGRFLMSIRDFAGAITPLQQADKYNPNNAEVVLLLGEAAASMENTELLDTLLANIKPNSKLMIEVQLYLSALRDFMKNDLDSAGRNLDLAPQLSTRRLANVINVQRYLAARDADKLLPVITALLGNNPSRAAKQRAVMTLSPLMAEYALAEDFAPAAKIANKILEFTVDEPPNDLIAFAHILAMYQALESGFNQDAIMLARNLLNQQPANPAATIIMAQALLNTMQADDSLRYFNKLDANNVYVLHSKAQAFLQLNKIPEAEKCFAGAIALAPGDPAATAPYIDYLFAAERNKELEDVLAKLDDSHSSEYLKHYFAGQIAFKAHGQQAAVPEFIQALSKLAELPDSDGKTFQAAFMNAVIGNDNQAAVLYRQLLSRHPDSAIVMVNLAECEFALGNLQAGRELADQAYRRFPDWEPAKKCKDRLR